MATGRLWIAAAVTATAIVSGISGTASARTAPPPRQVVIENIAFAPGDLTATVGDTVEWVNKDIVAHTSTGRKGEWDVSIPAGEKARVVLKAAGTVEYYCQYHPNMKARIVIKAK